MHLISHLKTKAVIILTLIAISFSGYAQAPNLLNYQGVARNAVGNPLPNQTINLRLSVHNLSASGTVVYTETRPITTNLGGLFSVQIGSTGASSTTGSIAGVNWLTGDKYLQVEIDPASNNNYLNMGTVQLISVPYAFNAATASNALTVTTNANLTGVVTSSGNATAIANGAITNAMLFNGAVANLSGTNTGDQTLPTLISLGAVASNTAITGATNTKITYDAKGLVTAGAAATTADIAASTNKNYVTDAQQTVIGNTSGTNTGDNSANSLYSGLVSNATHTGDATGSNALTVVKINGTLMSGLATGILKNTTATGIPSIAVASDFPTLNQNTSGTASNVTGTVAVANGGSGATTKTTAFNALSPMTSSGDIIYGGASGTGTRLAKGTDAQVLTLAGGLPTWAAATAGVSSVGSISGSSDVKGATISGSTITLTPADASNGGIVTIGDQIFSGAKTFNATITGSINGNATTATTAITAGTATTATKFATARNINGVAFDGSGDITVTADAGTLTGTTLNSSVTGSSLTSVGTITSGVWSGTAVAVEKGGTGLTSAGTNGQVLSTTGSGTLAWTTPSTTATAYSGTLPVANGGTGAATLTANNVLLGNGTSALQAVAPGTTGNILTSNGTTWTSAAPSVSSVHTIGESYGGGKVFYVTTDGLHGLIAETQDQSSSCSWYNAQDIISTSSNHSTAGKLFTDWRLPTKYELNLLYLQKVAGTVGGFATERYWSSTEFDYNDAYLQHFGDGNKSYFSKSFAPSVRAIRAF